MNLSRIKDHKLATFEQLCALLRVDMESGTLWWREGSGRLGRACSTPADPSSYGKVRVGGFAYAAHRVVWLLTTGAWPKFVVDHIDGDRHNNRPSNLRDVTHAENQRNQKYHRTGTRKPDHRRARHLQLVKSARPSDEITFTRFEAEMARLEADHA